MKDKEIIESLKEKISKDSNFIRYTFYELKVKYNLTEKDLDRFLILIRAKLENENYKVYFTDSKFIYQNANRTVQLNEILIAIKE